MPATLGVLVIVSGLSVGVLARSIRHAPARRRFQDAGIRGRAPELPLPEFLIEPIDRAALGVSPGSFLSLWGLTVALALTTGAVVAVVGVALLLVVAALAVPAALLFLLRHRRDRQIELDLPTALESIGRSVRSGASFPQAVTEAVQVLRGPLQAELSGLDRRIELGQPFGLVLREWSERRPLPGVRLAAAALAFSYEAGGVRSRAVDGLADSLRDRSALEREVAALASQARMSGMVISVLPIGFVFVSTTLDAQVAGFLFGTPLGVLCLAGGLALDGLGFVWMHHLTGSIK